MEDFEEQSKTAEQLEAEKCFAALDIQTDRIVEKSKNYSKYWETRKTLEIILS